MSELQVDVYDHDVLSSDDFLGTVLLKVSSLQRHEQPHRPAQSPVLKPQREAQAEALLAPRLLVTCS